MVVKNPLVPGFVPFPTYRVESALGPVDITYTSPTTATIRSAGHHNTDEPGIVYKGKPYLATVWAGMAPEGGWLPSHSPSVSRRGYGADRVTSGAADNIAMALAAAAGKHLTVERAIAAVEAERAQRLHSLLPALAKAREAVADLEHELALLGASHLGAQQ